MFSIGRGTKQGDPLSPSLLNSILEHAMKYIKTKWCRKGWGIKVGNETLCNLRFADDVVLVGSSKRQLIYMLTDLIKACSAVGLEIHMGKTKKSPKSLRYYKYAARACERNWTFGGRTGTYVSNHVS